jgi:hypothetical protein
MTEGEWIAMPGVPLLNAEGSGAAAPQGGEAAGVPEDETRSAEDITARTTEEGPGGDAPGAAAEEGEAEAAAGTAPSAPAGLETASATEEEVTLAPVEAAAAVAPTEENTAADASDAAHAAELKAALLAASSPDGEEPAEAAVAATVASVGATEASAVLDEGPVVAEGVKRFGLTFVKE